jgi:hypothetical protein
MSGSIRHRIGQGLMTLIAFFTAISPYVADWNVTHIYNPRWPPHAKFHNGQTMVVGVLLGLGLLVFTWRRSSDARGAAIAAILFAGFYWWSQAGAFFFPGAAWTDPEFLKDGQTLTQIAPQAYLDGVMTLLIALAGWLIWPREGDAS